MEKNEKRCVNCGKDVNTRWGKCPYCGKSITRISEKWLLLLGVLTIIIYCLFSLGMANLFNPAYWSFNSIKSAYNAGNYPETIRLSRDFLNQYPNAVYAEEVTGYIQEIAYIWTQNAKYGDAIELLISFDMDTKDEYQNWLDYLETESDLPTLVTAIEQVLQHSYFSKIKTTEIREILMQRLCKVSDIDKLPSIVASSTDAQGVFFCYDGTQEKINNSFESLLPSKIRYLVRFTPTTANEIERCTEFNNTAKGWVGSGIIRLQMIWDAKIYDLISNKLVTEKSFSGSLPRPCATNPEIPNFYYPLGPFELFGEAPNPIEVNDWVKNSTNQK